MAVAEQQHLELLVALDYERLAGYREEGRILYRAHRARLPAHLAKHSICTRRYWRLFIAHSPNASVCLGRSAQLLLDLGRSRLRQHDRVARASADRGAGCEREGRARRVHCV